MKTIFWFKRDLRIDDNRAFYRAIQESKEIIPIFIFNDDILEKFNTHGKKLGFVVSAVEHLDNELKKCGSRLYCFKGTPKEVFQKLLESIELDSVYTTKSESWMGTEIERDVEDCLKSYGKKLIAIRDGFLVNETIPYTKVFTPFYNKWKNLIDLKTTPKITNINTPKLPIPTFSDTKKTLQFEKNYTFVSDPWSLLNDFDFKNYENTRDFLHINGTSRLSPYIRLGMISVRKLYKYVLELTNENNQFLKELCWREFWYHIKENFAEFKHLEFQEKRREIKWQNDERLIDAFLNAKTGYPIIDAAIIQLKTEFWMHGRARMIVASFLTKDLLVDWRIGEEFFMKYLLDYDEAVNVGNWQWSASVGPDPKPMRIFNPILQAQKFDPEGSFIKKYIPELKNLPAHMLHDPLKYPLPYYKPIVNHYENSKIAKKLYLKTL